MSSLRLGLKILAIDFIFFAHEIQAGRFHPDKEPWYEQASEMRSGKSFFAAQVTSAGSYYGAVATMDVYGHKLTNGQVSTTAIWITNMEGAKSDEDAIWIGWHIYPKHYGDSDTHFFTYWTRDAYYNTGCFNMDCPGFEPAHGAGIAPGAIIVPVSDANGVPTKITIKVYLDNSTGKWWIHAGLNGDSTVVGSYPATVFDRLSKKATHLAIGGIAKGTGTILPPPMGSGSLPSDKAASFTDVSYVGEDGKLTPFPVDTDDIESESSCYSITHVSGGKCFYGGPGGCSLPPVR